MKNNIVNFGGEFINFANVLRISATSKFVEKYEDGKFVRNGKCIPAIWVYFAGEQESFKIVFPDEEFDNEFSAKKRSIEIIDKALTTPNS